MTTHDRVAVVTGGAAGLGLATVRRLLDAGCAVAVADLRRDAAVAAAAEVDPGGERVLALEADVTDTPSTEAMVAATLDRFGRLDVLVNNAGIAAPSPTHTVADAAWTQMLDVHLHGTLRCSRAAFAALSASPAPAIVNIASIAARVGIPMRASYTAAKCAIEGLTRVLAVEWAPLGIRVNCIAPGFMLTAAMQALIDAGTNSVESMSSMVPLGRMADPGEVAEVIAFVAGPGASYLTGQTLFVDGGMTIDGRMAGFDYSLDPGT